MYSKAINSLFFSKISKMLFFIVLSLFSLSQTSNLEAGGWGQTKEVFEYEGILWNGVYFDMNKLKFSASIPNYSGTILQDGLVFLQGEIEEDIGYVIIVSFDSGFIPPKSTQEFVKMIQEANPNYIVNVIDSKKLGAKYAVDLIPINQKDDTAFWRFLATKDRLIQAGTDDSNESRRLYFFNSLHVDK